MVEDLLTWHKLFPEELPKTGSYKQKREKEVDQPHLLVVGHPQPHQPTRQNARTGKEKGQIHQWVTVVIQMSSISADLESAGPVIHSYPLPASC